MRRTLLLLISAVIAVTALGVSSAGAYPVAHVSQEAQGKVLRYWTAERMQKAVPADRDSRPVPAGAKPAKGGGTAAGVSTEVPLPYPSAFGKVFFTSNSGVNYVCSGTAILGAKANESVVWTAGHCVNEGPGDFYRNFAFVPAYRDGIAPYGKFAGTKLFTTSNWQKNGEWGVDVGAALVSVSDSSRKTLSDAVDEAPIVFDALRAQSYKIYGYPAAKKFSGQRLRVCNTTWLMNDTFPTPDTMGASCDMTGGSSGGAWVVTTSTGTEAVASVVSYGYSSLRNVLFGPHLEAEAQSLYTAAQTQ